LPFPQIFITKTANRDKELSFLHHQDRALCLADDPGGDAPHQQPGQAGEPVTAHDDPIGAHRRGLVPLSAPGCYGEILTIETRLQEVRSKALVFRFELFPETGRDLVAEGTANLVAIGADWRARELPERVRSALRWLP
jgi:hypothetical protein